MSVNEFLDYEEKINLNQTLYVFLTVIIIIFGMIVLNLFKKVDSLTLEGVLKDGNIIEFKLNKEDLTLVLNSKKIFIHDEIIDYQIIEIQELDDNYLVKLSLDKIYLNEEILKVKFILKEEKLYKFIYETVKGDI